MKIIIPSMGRCGSSLLTDLVREMFPDLPFVFRRSMLELPEEGIIKTHSWAPRELSSDTKYVYIYGDPLLSVISAHQLDEDFQRQHYIHLGACFELRECWPVEDVLHLRENYISWKRHYGEQNLFFISYEQLFLSNVMERLSHFLGAEIKVPEFKARATVVDQSNSLHLVAQKTYEGLLL
jgi:hypothetical protein